MTDVDNHIVRMTFDNQKFENGVKVTMNSLDKLKSSLKMDGAANGLSKVEKAASSISLSGLTKSVDIIAGRFTNLGIIGVTALQNIANKAVATGERMLKALTVEPVTTGFNEYETKMGAIQTIMSNTASKGTTMSEITATLDELNRYADKTIYNFAEMTRNIGTFTAAGIGLEDAASSIQGIANLAAASGSTSQQASTAMYQLSQALAAGTVKLMDWNSVVNAGMGGEKFQEALKSTAREYGVGVDAIIEKNGSFRESLKEGWISADILNDTLKKFTVEGAKEYSESMIRAGKYTREQADALIAEAKAMEDAATKVKTWTQLWDTLKESAQSGWAQSWEYVFGNFMEARDFFSEVSKEIGGIIEKSAEDRNKLLDGALTSNWTRLTRKITEAGLSTDIFEKKIEELATSGGYNVKQLIEKYGYLEKAIRSGEIPTSILKEALSSLGDVKLDKTTADLESLTETLKRGNASESVRQLQQALMDFGYDMQQYGADGRFGPVTEAAVKAFQKANGLIVNGIADADTINALKKLSSTVTDVSHDVNGLSESCADLIDNITAKSGREMALDSIMNAVRGIIKISGTAKAAFQEIFKPITPEQLSSIISSIHEFSKGLIMSDETADKFRRTCKGLFAILDIGASAVKTVASSVIKILCPALGTAGGSILDATANAGDAIVAFRDWLKENDIFAKGLDYLSSGIRTAAQMTKEWFIEFKNTPKVQKFLESFNQTVKHSLEYLEGGKQVVLDFVSRLKELDHLDLDTIKGVLKDFYENVVKYFFRVENITNGAKKVFESTKKSLSVFVDFILDKLGIAKEKLGAFFDFLGEKFGGIGFAEIALVGFAAAMVGVAISISKALKAIKGFLKGGLFGIGDMFDSVSGAFDALKFNLQVKAFATMIVTLVGALALMTTLDQEKLKSSAWVLGIFAGALVGAMTALSVLQHFKLLDDFQSNATAIVALSASLAIMVAALKGMEYVDKTTLLANLGTLAALMAMLAISAGLLGKFVPKLSSGSLMMVAYSAAILILTEAMEKLSEIPEDRIQSSILSLITLVGAMSVLALASKGVGIGAAFTMIAMVVTLNALVSAFDRIKMVDVNSIMANLDAFRLIFGAFIGLIVASKFSGKNASKAGLGILAMSVSLIIIADAFKKIAKLNDSGATKAMTIVGILLGVFTAITKATASAGDNAAKAGVTILAMAAGITILCGAIRLIAGLGVGDLVKATTVIGALGIVLGGILFVTKYAEKAKEATGTIIAITACIFALTIVVGLLSMVAKTNPIGLLAATIAVGILGGVIAGILVATKHAGKANIALLTATACIWVLSKILKDISELEVQSSLANAAALSLLMLSMSAMMAILQHVPAAGAANAAIAILAGLGTISAIVLVLGGIAELCGDHDLFGKGAEILGKLGTAIGSFLGNFVGSFSAGLTSGLPEIGENLKGFSDSLAQIPEGAGAGAKSLAAALTAITGSSFLEGLLTLGANNSVDKFAEQLPKLGNALSSFSDSISGLDEESIGRIKVASEAASGLAELSDSIPKTGGLISFFTGTGDLGTFAEDLSSFGTAMSDYSKSVKNLDTDAIDTSVIAAESLVDLAKTVPNTRGLIQYFTGAGDLSTFGSDLESFGTAIKKYGSKVNGLNTEAIAISVTAAESLVDLADIVPNTIGLFQLFTGDGSLGTFASDLRCFGSAIKEYGDTVNGLNTEAIATSVTAAEALVELANLAPDMASLWDHIAGGGGDLGTFGADIKTFGTCLQSYSNSVSELDTGKLNAATESFQKLIELAGESSVTNFSGFANFGTALAQLGQTSVDGFVNSFTDAAPKVRAAVQVMLSNVVAGVNATKGSVDTAFSTVVSGALSIITTQYSKFNSAGKTTMLQFVTGVRSQNASASTTVVIIVAAMLSRIRGQNSAFNSAGNNLMSVFVSGMASQETSATRCSRNVANAAANAISGYRDEFYNAGVYCVDGFARGISDRTWAAKAKASAMASASLRAAKKALAEHSPSKKFYEAGDFAVIGFANAFADGVSKVWDAGSGIAKSAMDGMRSSISRVSEMLDGAVDSNPTITPVFDLSNVQNGVSGLSRLMNAVGGGTISRTVDIAASAASGFNSRSSMQDSFGNAVREFARFANTSSNGKQMVNHNTFNITSNDPEEVAHAVAKVLQIDYERSAAAWG